MEKRKVSPNGHAVVDGSVLEGGGQILRMAAALCSIKQKPLVTVTNVRAGRKSPGLRRQHLTGLKLISKMCSSAESGLHVGSTQVSLSPSSLPSTSDHPITADTETAGSCTLLAQIALPCALYSVAEGNEGTELLLHLRGGTDASFAPPVGYLQHVLLPLLQHLQRTTALLTLHQRGFNPEGQGFVELRVKPLPVGQSLPSFQLTRRGALQSITIHSYTGGTEVKGTAELMAFSAAERLRKQLPSVRIQTHLEHDAAAKGFGSGILLVARYESGCLLSANKLGAKRTAPEDTGTAAAEELLSELSHGGAADHWLQDQLVIYMALAEGRSSYTCGRLTLHTVTAIRVAEQLTGATFTVRLTDVVSSGTLPPPLFILL